MLPNNDICMFPSKILRFLSCMSISADIVKDDCSFVLSVFVEVFDSLAGQRHNTDVNKKRLSQV